MAGFHKRRLKGAGRILAGGFTALLLAVLPMFFPASPGKSAELGDLVKEARLVPHKALYDISLVSTRSGSQIINISGQMFYDWQPSCEAWISNHRFNLLYEYADSPAMRITSDFSTFETFDGKEMNFTSQRKRDGLLFEELRGHATIDEKGAGEANYTIPKGLVFNIPEGSFFPMGHTLEVLANAKKGRKFFNATIFDGSDDEGPVDINAFIGKPVDGMANAEESPDIDASLLNTPAWNVRLAFFPLNKPETTSDYEMTMVFHENGVISHMVIEYDDFTISQKLVALEPLGDLCAEGASDPEPEEAAK